MNFNLYFFGTPNDYNQYPADKNAQFFQEFYQKQQTDSQFTIYRTGQLIYYVYARKLSLNSSNHLGICLIFNGIYCRDTQQLFELFDKAYSEIALNGEILRIDKNGKTSFVTDKFVNKQLEIERIKLFFQNNLENNFRKDFTTITTSLKVGNGTKTLSINDENSNFLAAIHQYDCVYISNNEKSDLELDRIHKMLSDLYAEKQDLNTKYKKLLGQKKQYKVVILLCVAIIGCIFGLVIFNENLQSKDSKIQSLETELTERNDTITTQRSNIAQLQITQSKLNREISNLNETVNQKNTIIDEKTEEIQNLSYENSNLNSENSSLTSKYNSLRSEIRDLKNQNQQLTTEISSTKNSSAAKYYKVTVSQAYCYRQCAGSYSKNDCYYSSGAVVEVYAQRDGYGLTTGGYLKMSELQKY